ncbi:MAG: hypothetical protein ACI4C1_01170 [Lachnospiraceae bacterium]
MTLSVEEKIPMWLEQYPQICGIEMYGYEGGYPRIKITLSEELAAKHSGKWDLSMAIKNCELNAGYKTGMAYNLMKSSKAEWNSPVLTVSGHPEVLEGLLKHITEDTGVKKGKIFQFFSKVTKIK